MPDVVIPTPAGKGAFGVVHLGVDKGSGEQVAVKSISKAKLVCKEDVQDVQAEVAIMNLVAGHPNVVTLRVGWLDLKCGVAEASVVRLVARCCVCLVRAPMGMQTRQYRQACWDLACLAFA
jgi:hypothetical protein